MARKFVRIRKPHIAVGGRATVHGRQEPTGIVLHDTESHDTAGIRDIAGIYDFWQHQGLGYGAHFVVDGDGNIGQGAKYRDITWHTGNFNTGLIGIEQIGFASLARAVWRKKHREQLRAVARLLAWLHVAFLIPLRPGDLETRSGVFMHRQVSASGIDPSGHTDPGRFYPFRFVLWLARRYVSNGGWYISV